MSAAQPDGLGDLGDRWSDAALDAWRGVTDPPADAAVAAHFAAGDGSPGALFATLVRHHRLPPEDREPAIIAFLEEQATLPPWADLEAVRRGQVFFSEWVLHQFTALYLAALPNAYAAAKGAHVIWLTGRLREDPERRLNETAQFLMDISAPGSFTDGSAVDRILHVRLMHAAIRWLTDHDPSVTHPPDAAVDGPPVGLMWSPAWGRPINQEDLAGTMLTFTTVVLDGFGRSGVSYSDDEATDFLHLWRVTASLLGVVDELLPRSLSEATDLQRRIFARQQRRSAVGIELTGVLLDLVRDRLPRALSGLAAPMLRRYVGDEVADLLAVPRSGSYERVLDALVWLTRVTSMGRRYWPVPHALSRWVGRRLVTGVLEADRHGARVPFAIPDRLLAASPALRKVAPRR